MIYSYVTIRAFVDMHKRDGKSEAEAITAAAQSLGLDADVVRQVVEESTAESNN